jgi:predicted HTH domain antitoxin
MEKQLSVTYPESLANYLELEGTEFAEEIKLITLAKLYELGKISSGTAARILNMSRIDFLEKIADYEVSHFGLRDEKDLDEDIANA